MAGQKTYRWCNNFEPQVQFFVDDFGEAVNITQNFGYIYIGRELISWASIWKNIFMFVHLQQIPITQLKLPR